MKTLHKIIIGDSRQMKEVSDESVHLIITSPPYWQLKDYGGEKKIHNVEVITEIEQEIERLQKWTIQTKNY